jgi:hypothetical protein
MYRIEDHWNRDGFLGQHRICFFILVSPGSSCHYSSNLPDTQLGDGYVEWNLEHSRVYKQMC